MIFRNLCLVFKIVKKKVQKVNTNRNVTTKHVYKLLKQEMHRLKMFVDPTVNKRESQPRSKTNQKRQTKIDDANGIRKQRALKDGCLGGSSLWSQESQESQLAPE